MNYKNVLNNCNLIKCFMMISVILCHSLSFWTNGWFLGKPAIDSCGLGLLSEWLGTFHVWTFTFISGYIFCYSKFEAVKYSCITQSIKSRAIRILVPYCFTALFWVIPWYIYYFNPSSKTLFSNFILGIRPSQLWFLLMIFSLYVILLPMSDYIYHSSFSKGIIISLLFWMISFIGGKFTPNIFQVWTACYCFLFYFLGFSARKYQCKYIANVRWYYYFLLNILFFMIALYLKDCPNTLLVKLLRQFADLGARLSGVLMVFVGLTSLNIERFTSNTIYKFLEKYNFGMYLLHQQIIYVVLANLDGKLSNILVALTCFLVSVLVSGFITWSLYRFEIGRRLLGAR